MITVLYVHRCQFIIITHSLLLNELINVFMVGAIAYTVSFHFESGNRIDNTDM